MPIYSAVGIEGVSSQFYLASIAGLEVLNNGGNAFDAAIAISSLLTIALPYTSSIGGDGFLFAIGSDGELVAYNGSGCSSSIFPIDLYLREKPVRGPLTITVPGLVDLWNWVWENYGSIEPSKLLKPAISLAENGFYAPQQLVRTVKNVYSKLSIYDSWRRVFGQIKPYSYICFKELARILKILATRGFREFYEGYIAEEIVSGLIKEGVPITYEDFSQHKGQKITPIKIKYKGYDIYELPPNTQGVTTLEILKLIEHVNINKKAFNDIERIKQYFKIVAQAYADRDKFLGDPRYIKVSINELLNENRLRNITRLLRLEDSGDTTFFVVGDKYGNLVGFIQSIFYPFGSGVVVKEIPFQNRGYGFSKRKGLPNSPAPRKRPLHTLSILIARNDREDYIIGCAGGDLRPQIHVEVLTGVIDYKKSLSEAVDLPRYMLIEWRNGKPSQALIEQDLDLLGTLPKYMNLIKPKSPATGIVHALKRVNRGVLEFVADYRGGGLALAK